MVIKGLVVKEGMVDRYLFDGGYVKATVVNPTTYTFEFYYYNKDHLGNNREVVDSAGVVRQVTSYYPFGTPYTDPAAVMNANMQPYKYNGTGPHARPRRLRLRREDVLRRPHAVGNDGPALREVL